MTRHALQPPHAAARAPQPRLMLGPNIIGDPSQSLQAALEGRKHHPTGPSSVPRRPVAASDEGARTRLDNRHNPKTP